MDAGLVHHLLERDDQRVRLLAGRAAGDPGAHDVIGGRVRDQLWQHRRGQGLVRLGIAEERCDADQQLLE